MADFVADLERRAIERGLWAGVTWGDFKRAIEGLGVRDDDRLASIEYGVAMNGRGVIVRDDDDMGVEIREVL